MQQTGHDALASQITELRDQFQAEWSELRESQLEDFVNRAPSSQQKALFDDLLAVDIQKRRDSGDSPRLDDYLNRFPGFEDTIRRQLVGSTHSGAFQNVSTAYFPPSIDPQPALPETAYQSVGRYQLLELLGSGGFGEVWRAKDPDLARDVAVKVLRHDRAYDQLIKSFLLEGQRLASLRHPNIVEVFDCGCDEGRFYIVSRLIPSGTLFDLIKAGPIDVNRAIEIIITVADAAHYAHTTGIVHRDIKPQNILIDSDGAAQLADFGLAVTEFEQLEEPQGTVGTYAYMAPEQHKGESHLVDCRADVYSLGVMLYELLVQRKPYIAKSRQQYTEQVLTREARPLRSINDAIPQELETICLQALRKNCVDRQSTAGELANQLRSFLAERRKPKRSKLPVIAGVAVSLIVIVTFALFGGALVSGNNENPGRDEERRGGDDGDNSIVIERTEPGVAINELDLSVRDTATWEILEDGDSIRAFADDLLLLSLGEQTDERRQFSADLSQKIWDGGVGIFCGFKKTGRDPADVEYVVICLEQLVDETFRIAATAQSFSVATPFAISNRYLATYELPEPPADVIQLKIVISNGSLEELQINGKSPAGFLDRLRERLGETTTTGRFGVYTFDTNATISNLLIDGKRKRLEK